MDEVEPWLAHEGVDRPFDRGTWLDDCADCRVALKREVAERPRLVLCLKTECDRVCVTAEYLAEILQSGLEVEALCYVDDDRVREVFVVADDALWPPARWWSLTLAEEEQRAGRKSRPRTQTQAGRRSVRKEVRVILKKYGLPTTGELFDRSYAYIRENY